MIAAKSIGEVRTDRGNLKELLERNHLATVQHGYEVLRDQLSRKAEKDSLFYTSDTAAYASKGSTALLHFGRGYTAQADISKRVLINPVFAHIEEAYVELLHGKGIFAVPDESTQRVRKHIEPVDMHALRLIEDERSYCGHFDVPTDRKARKSLSEEQRCVAGWALLAGKT
jgi:hypothetical protein